MDPENLDIGPKVKRLAQGGSITKGEEVYFEFETVDGARVPLHTDYGTLSQIVTGLQSFGQMAQNDQKGRPAGTNMEEIVQPWRARAFKAGWAHDGSQAAIHFQTYEGVPVMVAMPPNLVAELRDALEDLASRRPRAPRPQN